MKELQSTVIKLAAQRQEYKTLKDEFEYFEFESYQDLTDEIQRMMNSRDYQTCETLQGEV